MIKRYLHYQSTLTSTQLKKDFLAGLTIFVILVPQAIAYGLLVGVPPVMGLYAATIPLFVYAFFSSSRHLAIGPTAITSLLVFTGVSSLGVPGSPSYISYVLTLAIMIGLIQLILGIFQVGFIVRFIPNSVLKGYTSAAAIIIAVSQLKHLFGISIGNHLQLHLLLMEIGRKFTGINLITVLIGTLSIFILVILRKIDRRIPAALLIVFFSTVAVYMLNLHDMGIQIVGDIPKGFPAFIFPTITLDLIRELLPMALTIALLGFMESLAIGKTVARKEKYTLYANQELKALGLANLVGACFQAIPVNGSFSRTALNHQAGAVTQLSSLITGFFVLLTVIFFTSFFYYLPHAVLAAIIIVAVAKLVEFKELKHLYSVKPFEGRVWLVTFLTTLFVGIQWGILLGASFTLLLILKKSVQPNIVEIGYIESKRAFRDVNRFSDAKTLDHVLMMRIDSNLHSANISFLEEKLKSLLLKKSNAEWVVIDMSGVNDVDISTIESFEQLIDSYGKEKGIQFLFANMKGSVRDTAVNMGWEEKYSELISYYSLHKLCEEKGFNYHQAKEHPDEELDFYI